MPAICFFNNTVAFNEKGGKMTRYLNGTGAASVKGTLVQLDSNADLSVDTMGTSDPDCVGVIWSAGVADGDPVWVVTEGPAEALLEDSTASTRENWVRRSPNQAGRADATLAAPSGGTINELREHLEGEVGHCMESVSSGTDVLCWIHLHFN